KVIIQILASGTRIFGKAVWEASRQVVKRADVAGVGNARSGSITDQLTRQHRMTVDEASLILNTKKDANLEAVMKQYEHLFKANSPPARIHSHYLQSKVVRARERLEAELKGSTPPPPPPATAPPPKPSAEA
ncbi:hypothetical protein CYLTODRAFT_340455, partial [Cylindrobasidium torrendii FP15055 ss-10]